MVRKSVSKMTHFISRIMNLVYQNINFKLFLYDEPNVSLTTHQSSINFILFDTKFSSFNRKLIKS